MNITPGNKFLTKILFTALLGFSLLSAGERKWAQTDTSFSLSAEIGIGMFATQNDLKDIHISPSFSLYWKPNHLLNIGLEGSLLRLKEKEQKNVNSEFGITDFHGVLQGYPIILVLNMQISFIEIYGGIGLANVRSTVDAFNKKVVTYYWYNCYYFSTGYKYRCSNRFESGILFRFYSFPKLEQTVLGLSLIFDYDFIRW